MFFSTAVFDAKILVRSLSGRTKRKFSHRKLPFYPVFGAQISFRHLDSPNPVLIKLAFSEVIFPILGPSLLTIGGEQLDAGD